MWKKYTRRIVQVALFALGFAGLAQAQIQTAAMAKYEQECAACHIAYPPGMLPQASWGRLLQNLNKHFGVDASLDPAAVQEIGGWLQQHAGSYRSVREAPAQDRISKSHWFVSQHDEVSVSTFQRKSVGSASNCAACHPNAGKGRFSEHEVRIPK
jgi:cytochrome c